MTSTLKLTPAEHQKLFLCTVGTNQDGEKGHTEGNKHVKKQLIHASQLAYPFRNTDISLYCELNNNKNGNQWYVISFADSMRYCWNMAYSKKKKITYS